MSEQNKLLRKLPKIDLVLDNLENLLLERIPVAIVKSAIRETIDTFRVQILGGGHVKLPGSTKDWNDVFLKAIEKKNRPNLQRVINGTGVVIHTNLGRSLLGPESIKALQTAGAYFTNLEFDLSTGSRGSRYSLVEEIICDLTGAEAALVVNNNAAAVLLALNTLSFHKKTVVSRGQLVEIGGSFRIPDVMERSGALMVEVGATNRTHLVDYEKVIDEETALLLKVHTSNFRLIGFTSEVSASDLAVLGKQYQVPVMEDLGSGSLIDLAPWGLPKEPTVQEIVKAGVDVVTFSGDKLLGGPQAGIIVGKKDIIARIKSNPMNRALRIDKFTLASLEAVLREYYDFEQALQSVPTLSMLTNDAGNIKKKGQRILRRLGGAVKLRETIQLKPTVSRVGGGAMPEHGLDSWALVIRPGDTSASELERWFRGLTVPLILRIEDKQMIIDLRTILEDDIPLLIDILKNYLDKGQKN
ncbi:L-seryl-tRNA(Sec) selenium transferase [Desulfocapsa sp. AH-315-G09]|uniref:L-seryl-tRNA(Sec) selenium transferase n=1 Tax=Desulfotalea psychrophila TaxID=84980 RepID=A0ABS3AUA1_9BACT|nr:L-seryl-tRNA(Sec) selenium transferase [Desulfocapsa sp.]MBN4052847.1 L-seryl-tRNA(Sec) selenium transferase [bacterium AH-315-K15]MBN4060127.1 L-seryl-tRNA(Sec) selenium transferase [Desulfotalea psychrophila]MBN4065358.1 L-seryl-tRNA(Sec) selenium transferase [Desulfocapsa sp. AH-315-G09]MBN4068675.1 L-seryl-tRNA(Sec) selenium transferase [Desulfotalea psychrophila]